MVNLIISHQIFPSLLLGFVQKIEETIQQKQPADECWLLNSIHHGHCLHVQCFHTVWNFRLCRRHCLLLGPCFCQSWTVFSVLKQHRFMTLWLWNQYTLPYIISRLILLQYVDTYLSHRWLTGAYWGHHDNLNQSHFEIIELFMLKFNFCFCTLNFFCFYFVPEYHCKYKIKIDSIKFTWRT